MVTSRTGEASTLLQGYQCLNLITFRKNSTPVVTTVWFAQANNTIYVWTAKKSGKASPVCWNNQGSNGVRILQPTFSACATRMSWTSG